MPDSQEPPAPPHANTPSPTGGQASTPIEPAPWLSKQLANFLAIMLTLGVFYLAYQGDAQAQAAIISGFSMLVGLMIGSRLALKVPGKDR